VKDLGLHQGTFESPSLPFGSFASTEVPKFPPFPQLHTEIEAVFNYEVVSSSHGGFCHFLMQWYGRPQSNATWIMKDKFRELNCLANGIVLQISRIRLLFNILLQAHQGK